MIARSFRFNRLDFFIRIYCLIVCILVLGITLSFLNKVGLKGNITVDKTVLLDDFTPINSLQSFDYEKLVSFPHRKDCEGFFFEDLYSQLQFLGENSRPDHDLSETSYFLSLHDGSFIEKVGPQTKHYLRYGRQKLEFCSSATPLWLKVSHLEHDKAKIDAGIWLVNEESGVSIHRKSEMEFQTVSQRFDNQGIVLSEHTKRAFLELENLTYLGPDKLYEVYGGGQYEEFKHLIRVQIGLSVFYIKRGDIFVYRDKKWELQSLKDHETKEYPIAICENDSPGAFEIKAWDPSGVISNVYRSKGGVIKTLPFKMEDVLKNIRVRGDQTFTCKVQQKNHLLRVGDWLLKQKGDWKILNKWDEMQSYLSYQILGELFVIDEIEKRQGSTVLKGTLFDKMRTHVQVVKIPLEDDKKTKKRTNTKKNQVSKKFESSTQTISMMRWEEEENSPGELLAHFIETKQTYEQIL